jgi:hypothetical protein
MIIYHTEERKGRKVFFNEKNLSGLSGLWCEETSHKSAKEWL